MTVRPHTSTISLKDQLAAVQRLLHDLTWARNDPALPEYATFHALRAIADGLAARVPHAAEECRRILGWRIATAVKSKTETDWHRGHLANVGLELISRWAVVEQALERMERETKGTAS